MKYDYFLINCYLFFFLFSVVFLYLAFIRDIIINSYKYKFLFVPEGLYVPLILESSRYQLCNLFFVYLFTNKIYLLDNLFSTRFSFQHQVSAYANIIALCKFYIITIILWHSVHALFFKRETSRRIISRYPISSLAVVNCAACRIF